MADDVPCIVPEEHAILVDSLTRLGAKVGTVAAGKIGEKMINPELLPPSLDPSSRLLTAGMPSVPAMNNLLARLGMELHGTDYGNSGAMGRLVLLAIPPDHRALAVFLDVLIVPESELY